MTLNEWIKSEFKSARKASLLMGIPQQTLNSWCTFKKFPNLYYQDLLTKRSQGLIDFASWRSAYLERKASKT